MDAKITIRLLKTIEEMDLISGLERVIWDTDPIPTHQTYTAVKNGGLMLGAFSGDAIVGFSYSFPGIANGKLHLCSHMLGVHPDYQKMGIGKSLKEEQRRCAKEMGYDLIRWTFDPLECRNAYLNVSKLFAICDTYLENCYGKMEDGLNKGLPSDRFNIEWWITSIRVEENWLPKIANYNRPFRISQSEKGNPVLLYSDSDALPTNSEGIEIPIPQNFQLIKKNEPELALDWRMKTRTIFQTLFGAGYALVNVRRTSENVHYYQVVKKESIPLSNRGEF